MLLDKANFAIVQRLGNKVLRHVLKKKTIVGLWIKLDRVCMTKLSPIFEANVILIQDE